LFFLAGEFFDPYFLRGKQRDRAFAILTKNPQVNLIIPKRLLWRQARNYSGVENGKTIQFLL
jgi:hypothetical protein